MPTDKQSNNDDLASASRLIAEARVLRELSTLLNDPTETSFGGYVSVDDVYCSLKFYNDEAAQTLYGLAQTVQCKDRPYDSVSSRPNSWRYMWMFPMGETSVRLGIGFNKASGSIDLHKGFIQFNPNKIGNTSELQLLFEKIRRFTKSIELKRYDVAIDIPTPRENMRMNRDRRGYDYMNHGNGMTEYLGSRDKPGRVKLYDKTREAGLTETWTRLELTCDGSWSAEKVLETLPLVFTWSDEPFDEETRATVKALCLSLALNLEHQEQIDSILDILPKKTKAKVLTYLAKPALNIELKDIEYAVLKAHEWRDKIAGEVTRPE